MARSTHVAHRVLAAIAVVSLAVSGLAGCDPKPELMPVALPPGGTSGRLVSINNAGLALGYSTAGSDPIGFLRAFTYDVNAGTTTDISQIPTGGGFPAGGTFLGVGNVNNQGVIFGPTVDPADNVGAALYDTATGRYTAVPCDGPTAFGTRRLSDGGLVACGTTLYDSHDGSRISVPQPDGCNGTIRQVNDNVAVGYCESGDEPLFVTDLHTGATEAFGAAQGLYDPDHDDMTMGPLTNGGLLVTESPTGDSSPSYIYDVRTASPRIVPLGGSDAWPGIAYGASDSGLVAVAMAGANEGDAGGVVIVDTSLGVAHAFSSESSGFQLPYAVNNAGQVVGAGDGDLPFVGTIPVG
jgi:hypothetical protein